MNQERIFHDLSWKYCVVKVNTINGLWEKQIEKKNCDGKMCFSYSSTLWSIDRNFLIIKLQTKERLPRIGDCVHRVHCFVCVCTSSTSLIMNAGGLFQPIINLLIFSRLPALCMKLSICHFSWRLIKWAQLAWMPLFVFNSELHCVSQNNKLCKHLHWQHLQDCFEYLNWWLVWETKHKNLKIHIFRIVFDKIE